MDLTPLGNFFCTLFSLIFQQQENSVSEKSPSASGQSVLPKEINDMIKNIQEQIELKNNAMTERVDELEAKLKRSKEQIDKLENIVVFSAAVGRGNDHVKSSETATTLIFTKLITNIGNAYNNNTGIFVAPCAGIYYFVFFHHAGGKSATNLYLVKENDRIVRTQNHKLGVDIAQNGGNAAFLELKKHNQVYISLEKGHVWGSDTHTTFSGFLVKRTEDEKADSAP